MRGATVTPVGGGAGWGWPWAAESSIVGLAADMICPSSVWEQSADDTVPKGYLTLA